MEIINKKNGNIFFSIKRLLKFLGPYKCKFIVSFACLILSTILSIYQPLVLGNLIDNITYKKWNYIPKLLILVVGLSLISSIFVNIYSCFYRHFSI